MTPVQVLLLVVLLALAAGITILITRLSGAGAHSRAQSVRRLVDMTDEELLNEQRKLVTDRAETFAVEFVARMTSVASNRTSTVPARGWFVSRVEKELSRWLPLGGRIHNLSATTISGGSSRTVLRCIAYLEVRNEVDAHEVAEAVCRKVAASENDYDRVLFMPVVQPARLRSGNKPGLWTVTDVKDSTPRKYSHVVTRQQNGAVVGGAAEAPASDSWTRASDELLRVTNAFADFEFSPIDVAFTRRLLWDLTEPATARFYEAFGEANALRTHEEPRSAESSAAFVAAVERAAAAWDVADRNARDKAEQNVVSGGEVLSPERAKHRDTALAAMTLALNPSSTDAEAGTAWGKTVEALDRAGLTVPASKFEKLERVEAVSRAMRALTSGKN